MRLKQAFNAVLLALVAMIALPSVASAAASNYWVSPNDSTYDWSDGTNWSAGVPVDDGRVVFRSSNAFQAATPSNNDLSGLSLSDLVFAGNEDTNGFLLSGNEIAISNEIRNVNSGQNVTTINTAIAAAAPMQITSIEGTIEHTGDIQLYGNRILMRSFKGGQIIVQDHVFGGAGTALYVSGDGNQSSVGLTATSYVGVPVRILAGGSLYASGALHDKLVMTQQGLLHPVSCLDIYGNLYMSRGYYYPTISGLASNGIAACSVQNKTIVHGAVEVHGKLAYSKMLDSGYRPALGSRYILISNDGTDPIKGRFSGLPEGTTFAVKDMLFKITYYGGTGNDIMVTRIGSA